MTQECSPSAGSYIVPEFAENGRPELRSIVMYLDGLIVEFEDDRERQQVLIQTREEVYALANGAALNEMNFTCVCVALGEVHSGPRMISVERLNLIQKMMAQGEL